MSEFPHTGIGDDRQDRLTPYTTHTGLRVVPGHSREAKGLEGEDADKMEAFVQATYDGEEHAARALAQVQNGEDASGA